MEAEVGLVHSENGGNGHEPTNTASSSWEKETDPPGASRRECSPFRFILDFWLPELQKIKPVFL